MADDDRIDQAALAGALGGSRHITLASGRTVSLAGSVVIDLDGNGVLTSSRDASGVRYDLDGDGLADMTSWIGATEGFLFLDRDGNGTVSDAGELGFLADVPGATSDLQGLGAFDANHDGLLSALDARWADFRIWQDKNGNGVAETAEILTLATAGVRSIGLAAAPYTGTNAAGDVAIVAKGSYTRTSGATMSLIDAALTYVSAPRDGLPDIAVVSQTYDRKASNYRVVARDGRLTVVPRSGGGTVDPRAGGLAGSVELSFKHSTVGMLTAIILDLDGDGVTMVRSSKSRGWFDMNGDGSPDEQGWAGRRDGFLVIDRNGDGAITDGSELSLLAEDPTAGSSLAALAKLDSNGDKVIDKTDARFGELRVWIDANGNGVTDGGELRTLDDLGIQSISLDSRTTTQRVKPGQNLLLATATFTYANGMKRTLGDAALAFSPSLPDPIAKGLGTAAPDPVPVLPTTGPSLPAVLPTPLDQWTPRGVADPGSVAATATPMVAPWLAVSSDTFAAAIAAFGSPSGMADVGDMLQPIGQDPLGVAVGSSSGSIGLLSQQR